MTPVLRRIAEIERLLLEQASTAAETCERPAHLLTDAEAADVYRRICKVKTPRPPSPFTPQQEAALLAEWRELKA